MFRLANNYLDPGGVFIFDLNTEYKYKELMGENTFAELKLEMNRVLSLLNHF